MKKNYTLVLTILLLLLSSNAYSQVTIGSGTLPISGALLDLKQQVDGSSSKGLGLPRVKISTTTPVIGALAESIGGEGDWNEERHTGLIVYHVSGEPIPSCAAIPDGLYVWDGAKWIGLSIKKSISGSIDFGAAALFNLPSGKDGRPMTAQNFMTKWTPTSKYLEYTYTHSTGMEGISFTDFPLLASPITTSASPFSLLPDMMVITDPKAPWQSKETNLDFSLIDDCGNLTTKQIKLNQTNYALKVNGALENSLAVFRSTALSPITVEGNATWNTSLADPQNIISTTTPAIGTAGGSDITNYPVTPLNAESFSYTLVAQKKYSTSKIIFEDTQNSPKRFDDIEVSILNCDISDILTMDDWAKRAGFTQAQINSVAIGGTHATTQPNAIQLHRDQDGNIFLSGLFGTERWMLNNLAAITYAEEHMEGREMEFDFNLTQWHDDEAFIGYPNINGNTIPDSKTLYNQEPRIGMLYTWDAATGGKGGYYGDEYFEDGENASTPNTDPQTIRIQGACPNGWYLPSDYEWTMLEKEIDANTDLYSTMDKINEGIELGGIGYRGGTHVNAMKDQCPAAGIDDSRLTNGASNPISTAVRPGFNAILVGNADNYDKKDGQTGGYGWNTMFWTSSARSMGNAWSRFLLYNKLGIERDQYMSRHNMFSVRCKK